ncbi:MAG: hypothetical protein ACK50P_12115 [Planctomycetaceae bacterium]|jgi:hypothetical protein
MPRTEELNHRLGILDKRPPSACPASIFLPVRSVQVLAQVDTAGGSVREQVIERMNLLAEVAQKTPIGPVGHRKRESLRGAFAAVRIDVHDLDGGRGTEIVPPHPQRPSLRDANFHHVHMPATKPLVVPMVDVKVVMPLAKRVTPEFRSKNGSRGFSWSGGVLSI